MKNHLVLLVLIFSGCAGSPLALREHEPYSAPWNGTAMLLNYEVDTADPAILEQGCTLTFHNLGDNHDYFIPLQARKRMILFDAPSGTYIGKTLSCPHFSKWDLDSFAKGAFTLRIGRINYLGMISFRFARDGSSLTTAQGGQAGVTRSLAQDLESFPASWKSALANPFTGRPITRDMLAPRKEYLLSVHTTRFLKKGEEAPSTESLESALRNCDRSEQKEFPYRLGTLNYEATYERQELKELKKEGHNSFSDSFISCLDQSLREFKPATGAKLEVTVRI